MRLYSLLRVSIVMLSMFPAAVSAQQPPAAEPRAPIPLGFAGSPAPWLRLRGEFRTRVEGFHGGGFTEGQDDAYWMDRFRVDASIRATSSIRGFIQVHDARSFQKLSGGTSAALRDTLDLRQAYGEVTSAHLEVRVGRQDLVFGEQRLIGSLPWGNTARSFDGARATLKGPRTKVDLLAVSVVAIQPEAFNKSGSGNALYGAYASGTWLPRQTIEPFLFWRQASSVSTEHGGTAPLHQATFGLRMAGPVASLDYSGDVVLQRGSAGADDISAWAAHGLVGHRFAGTHGRPRVFGEGNVASGDADGSDGTRGTFDQLYPTGHDKYGLADQVGWRNIRHLRGGLEVSPRAKWTVTGSYHSWWLSSVTDGLYSAGGALVARSAAGTAGRHVGQEVDLQAAFAYSAQLQLAGGLAHVFPGEFLKQATPGHSYTYPYVMATYVFLGEQPAIGRK